jgi:hypothetical protein
MMLSPSAARLGTSIRLKGKSIPFRHYSIGKNRRWQNQVFGSTSTPVSSWVPPTSRLPNHVRPVVVVSDITYPIRNKSTTATVSVIDDDDQPDEGIRATDTTSTTTTTTTNTPLGWSYRGHAAAAEYRLQQQQQQENQHVVDTVPTPTSTTTTTTTVASASESWRINLGRGTDNAWLMGSRKDDEWFTGIAPNENCPGRVLYI